MSSTKCFNPLPQVHARGAGPSPIWLAKSNFFPQKGRRHTFSWLFINENHELSGINSLQIDLSACTRVIYPLLISIKGCWRELLANLHAQTSFSQIGQGYLRRDLCVGILLHLR